MWSPDSAAPLSTEGRATPRGLQRPSALMLSRVDERLSFLYLDRCRVQQNNNGTVAAVDTADGYVETQLPVATLTALLLGPGTSVTQGAMASLSRAGCAVAFVGAGAVRSYGAFMSPFAPTQRLEAQAAIVSDQERRVEAARLMYLKRFPGVPSSAFAHATIDQLRGVEGLRMREVYQRHAKKARIATWRRNTGMDPKDGPPDLSNEILNRANSALYGVVNAVVLVLGLSPGLGIIHTGNRQSFTLDIADLYKTETTIPLAFTMANEKAHPDDVLRRLRDRLQLVRLLPRIVGDIDDVLGMADGQQDWDVNPLSLWGEQGEVQANRSHAEWTL